MLNLADDMPQTEIPNVPAPKKEEPVKQIPIPIQQSPLPQVIPLVGIILIPNVPLIRDAHPLAIMTQLGIIPINKKMVDIMVVELKKLEIIEGNEKNKKGYFS